MLKGKIASRLSVKTKFQHQTSKNKYSSMLHKRMMDKMDQSTHRSDKKKIESPAIQSRLNISRKKMAKSYNMKDRFQYSKNKVQFGISQYAGGYTQQLKSRLEKHQSSRVEQD
jgi:hypothetical protein